VAFQHLEDVYAEGVKEFKQMVSKHNITLPQSLSKSWSDETITKMAEVAYNLPHMWHQAYGDNWKEKVTIDSIKELYKRM
jgi:3-deoxy-alpha-D-manno-octulosonate 8-oxidase